MTDINDVLDYVTKSFGSDMNRTGEERSRVSDFLAREINNRYPGMSWQDCQSRARDATSYRGR